MTSKERYAEYLKSDHWKNLKKIKSFKHKRCSICSSDKTVDLHHLNYKNWTDVITSDLRWLCRKCHYLTHDLMESGVIKFKSDNHHSKFAIIKHQVKKHLGLGNKNLFRNEI